MKKPERDYTLKDYGLRRVAGKQREDESLYARSGRPMIKSETIHKCFKDVNTRQT